MKTRFLQYFEVFLDDINVFHWLDPQVILFSLFTQKLHFLRSLCIKLKDSSKKQIIWGKILIFYQMIMPVLNSRCFPVFVCFVCYCATCNSQAPSVSQWFLGLVQMRNETAWQHVIKRFPQKVIYLKFSAE